MTVDWFLLVFLAGTVNAGGYLACRRFVTHVTGFATLVGIEAVGKKPFDALGMLTVPLFFLAGVVVAALLVEHPFARGGRPRFALTMSLVALCLAAAATLGHGGAFGPFGGTVEIRHDFLIIALLCGASGLLNATISASSESTVRITHLTGVTTDLGRGIVRLWSRRRDPSARSVETRAAAIRLGNIISFSAEAGWRPSSSRARVTWAFCCRPRSRRTRRRWRIAARGVGREHRSILFAKAFAATLRSTIMLFDRRTLLPTLLIATAAACTSSTQVPKTQPPQASPCKTKKVGLGVVNGKPIDDATFPSVGWISAYNAQGDTNCSGAVVCDRVVLSASHCVAEQDGSSGWVYHFDTRGDLPSGEALKTTGTLVKERRMHPKYVMGGDGTPIPDHDVALFVLDTPIDAMMYPVWNPATKLDKADALATIIGYGYSDANESVYGKKLRAEMSFYGLDSNAIAVVVTDVDDSKGDTCGGDSGSTLWIKDITDGQMKGIGVLSQGDTDGCGKGTQSWWASLIDIDNRSWLTSQLKELCTGTTAFDIAKPTRTGAASGSGSGSGSGSASDASSGDGSASGSSSSSGSASKDEGSGSGAGSGTSSGAASEAGDC